MDYNFISRWGKKLKAINEKGGCCCVCGNNNIEHLSFHHTSMKDKECTISSLLTSHNKWNIIQKELEKCILVCENCHREIHYQQDLEKNDKRYTNVKDSYLYYLNTISCSVCGYSKCKRSLDLHHKDDKKIEFCNIRKRLNTIEDLDEIIRDELDKCIVLCANCHRTEHFNKEKYGMYEEHIIKKSNNLCEKQSKIDRNVVKKYLESGMKQIQISKILNCSRGTISDIINNKKYMP